MSLELPSDLIKATNELPKGTGKILVKVLLWGILIVGVAVGILWKTGNKSSDAALSSCQIQIKELNEQLSQANNRSDSLTFYIIQEAKDDIKYYREKESEVKSIIKNVEK